MFWVFFSQVLERALALSSLALVPFIKKKLFPLWLALSSLPLVPFIT